MFICLKNFYTYCLQIIFKEQYTLMDTSELLCAYAHCQMHSSCKYQFVISTMPEAGSGCVVCTARTWQELTV